MNRNHNSIQCNKMGFYLIQDVGLLVGLDQGMFEYRIYAIKYKIVLHLCSHCVAMVTR